MGKIGSEMGVAGPVSLPVEQPGPRVDHKHVPGNLGGMEVRRPSNEKAHPRPQLQSAKDNGPPLGQRHVEQLPGSPHAGRMTRQSQYAPLIQRDPGPRDPRAAAAELTRNIALELQPSEFLSEFGSQLRTAYGEGHIGADRFIATLDGLLDGLKAACGDTLSKDQLSAYLAFASHLPDRGTMQSAQRANLCLSRLAVALGADVNAIPPPADAPVGETMANTMASLGKVSSVPTFSH